MVDGPDDVRDARAASSSAIAAGRVARAVVDDDDLERLGERRQRLERLLDEPLEVRLLVVGREEVGQPGDAAPASRPSARRLPVARPLTPLRPPTL